LTVSLFILIKIGFNHLQETFLASEKQKMLVIFMTDGCDTCNDPASIMASKEKLQAIMAKYGEEVIVHVLGFSDQHDDAFLNELSILVSFPLFSSN
jgi:hypothetical protein